MNTPEPPAGETAGAQTLRRGLGILKLLARHQPEGLRIGEAEVLVSMYAGLLPGHSLTELRLRGVALVLQRAADGRWSVRGLRVFRAKSS